MYSVHDPFGSSTWFRAIAVAISPTRGDDLGAEGVGGETVDGEVFAGIGLVGEALGSDSFPGKVFERGMFDPPPATIFSSRSTDFTSSTVLSAVNETVLVNDSAPGESTDTWCLPGLN